MAVRSQTVTLTPELAGFVERRVKSGLYENKSEVVRAGLRALAREELAGRYREFEAIFRQLPQDPLTPEVEQEIVRAVRKSRRSSRRPRRR
jgi:putative addiction module CopG family antidote